VARTFQRVFFLFVAAGLSVSGAHAKKGGHFFARDDEARGNVRPASTGWSPSYDDHLRRNIPRDMFNLPPSSVGRACPNYAQMSKADRAAFIVHFFKSMAWAESDFVPTTRYAERGSNFVDKYVTIKKSSGRKGRTKTVRVPIYKKDSVTGLDIVSEGLMQVSYQDAEKHGCSFDWKADRKLGVKDSRKTIFDPKRNIQCAINIVAKQLGKGRELVSQGNKYYFACLDTTGGNHSKFMNSMRAFKPCFSPDPSGKPKSIQKRRRS